MCLFSHIFIIDSKRFTNVKDVILLIDKAVKLPVTFDLTLPVTYNNKPDSVKLIRIPK